MIRVKLKDFSVALFVTFVFLGCAKSIDNEFDAQKFECGSDFGSRDASRARVVRFVYEGGRKLLEPEARKLSVKMETKGGGLQALKVSSSGCVDTAEIPDVSGFAQAELGDLSARLQGAELESLPQTTGGVAVVRLSRDSHRPLCGTLDGKLLDPALPTIKLLTPEGGELPEKTLSAITFSIQRGVLSKLTPRGCIQLQSNSGIHFTAKGPDSAWMATFHAENSSSILAQKVIPLKLKSVETVTARFECPAEGLLSSGVVTVPFALESRGNLEGARFSARVKNLDDGKTSLTTEAKPLAGSAYRIEIDPAVLGADGRFGVELELRDAFGRSLRMERASECIVTVDKTPPAVPTLINLGGLESAQALTLQDGANIEFDFPPQGIPLSCVTPDNGSVRICIPDRTGGRTSKVGVTGEPQELHCASAMDAAGNLSLPRCVQVRVDRLAPEFEVLWDVPHLNENQGTWRGRLRTTSATIRLHEGSDDTTSENRLLDSLQCRVSFIDEKGGSRSAEFVRCTNGKCNGHLLRDFTPCNASLSFQVDEPESRIANSYVVLEARMVDSSGRATSRKRSFRNVPLENAIYSEPVSFDLLPPFGSIVTQDRMGSLLLLASRGILAVPVSPSNTGNIFPTQYLTPPAVEVTSIALDSNSRLWMGTSEGLYNHDGNRNHDVMLESSIPKRAVTALHSDALGNVWVAVGQELYLKFAGESWNALLRREASQSTSDIIGINGTVGSPLLSWREDGTIERSPLPGYFFAYPRPADLPAGRTWRSVFADRSGKLVALADGFLCRAPEYPTQGEDPWDCQQIPEGRALGAVESEVGILFVAVESHGLIVSTQGQWRRVDGLGRGVDCSQSPFFETAPNGDIICAQGELVTRFDVSELGTSVYTDRNSALRSSDISSLLLSNDGSVFAGIDGSFLGVGNHGLAKLEDTGWTHTLGGHSGFLGQRVSAIQEAPNGDKWVSTWDGGVSRWNGLQWQTFPFGNDGSGLGEARRLAIDSHGKAWVGTWGGGLFGFDGAEWQVQPHLSDSPDDMMITTVARSAAGGVWFGTWGGGLGFIDLQGTLHIKERMGSSVRALFEDSKGRLWVGLEKEAHLVKLNGGDRRDFYMWDRHLSGSPLGAGYVSAITEAKDGRIIAASGAGVGILDVESGSWINFDKRRNGAGWPRDGIVRSLSIAPNGRLWIGGVQGLVAIDPEFIPGQK